MYPNVQSRWWARGATFVLWALVAASASYWVFKSLGIPRNGTVPLAAQPIAAALDAQAVARALGGGANAAAHGPSSAPTSSRYALLGVLADRSSSGTALIAVDGKAAKPFRVGAAVADGLVLQSVTPRRALLAPSVDAPATVALDMPPLSK